MTWLKRLVCQIVDQATIQAAPVTCSCGRTAESAAVAREKWWMEFSDGWQCPGCGADEIALVAEINDPVPVPDYVYEAADLRAHLERVLRVVSEIGGYMSPEHQETIRAARASIATPRAL